MITHRSVFSLLCLFVLTAMCQQPQCPANSLSVTSGTQEYCVCNSGFTCFPSGTGVYCGAYMREGRVGFNVNCPSCQCLGMTLLLLCASSNVSSGYSRDRRSYYLRNLECRNGFHMHVLLAIGKLCHDIFPAVWTGAELYGDKSIWIQWHRTDQWNYHHVVRFSRARAVFANLHIEPD